MLHMILVTSHEEPETIELSHMIKGVPEEVLATIYGIDKNALRLSGSDSSINADK